MLSGGLEVGVGGAVHVNYVSKTFVVLDEICKLEDGVRLLCQKLSSILCFQNTYSYLHDSIHCHLFECPVLVFLPLENMTASRVQSPGWCSMYHIQKRFQGFCLFVCLFVLVNECVKIFLSLSNILQSVSFLIIRINSFLMCKSP